MKIFRIFLFPFAILYQLITSIRNLLFDFKILKSYAFNLPIICVGNLNVGGTGKTPQIEYLIRLLSDKYKLSTLSRGYKRSSNGFVLANHLSDANTIGDEPFQFFSKFKNIQVAVDADRKNGIENLLLQKIKPEIILLDDAYQHRQVKAGFYILLTAYNDLFIDDYLLPTGNLRESKAGADRADVIIVTKCPEKLSILEQENIKLRLHATSPVFFSNINYDEYIYSDNQKILVSTIRDRKKLIIAGIANPVLFFDYIKNKQDQTMIFADHHNFSSDDIINIRNKAQEDLIITTEKDFVRLQKFRIKNLFYLPIKCKFITDASKFDDVINDFVNNFKYS